MMDKFKRTAAALALLGSVSMAATPAMARGWGGGWGGGHRHNDRIDGGDVLAGILIIGGIAAIASAASKASKPQRDYREPEPRYRDDRPRYGSEDDRPEWREGTGIDSAVNRDAGGWRVSGSTTSNASFSCTIDRDGRIRNVNVDGRAI